MFSQRRKSTPDRTAVQADFWVLIFELRLVAGEKSLAAWEQ
jgi:hypothetical protein